MILKTRDDKRAKRLKGKRNQNKLMILFLEFLIQTNKKLATDNFFFFKVVFLIRVRHKTTELKIKGWRRSDV